MNPAQLELLRRLALSDDVALAAVMGGSSNKGAHEGTNRAFEGTNRAFEGTKIGALARIAALIALDAVTTSYGSAIDAAFAAGADDDDILDVLVAVAPVVGTARVCMAAPDLASALGYQLDDPEDW